MDSLFDKNHRYTNEAGELDCEASRVLQPIFQSYAERYSPREISHIMMMVVHTLECEVLIGQSIERSDNDSLQRDQTDDINNAGST